MSARPVRQARPSLRVIPGLAEIPVGLGAAIRRHAWLWVSGMVGLMLFFGVIYARVFLDQSAFEIADLSTRIAAEQQLNQDLRLEVAELESPSRVYEVALGLGLVHPTEPPLLVGSR